MHRRKPLYDQLRAIQAPAEMRRQQATQEQMFGRGTGGMTSGIYGGSGMQFADAAARMEQEGRDMLMARGIVGDDQDRRLLQAKGLMDAGYNPSNRASDLFTTGYNPATLATQGDIRGQELSAEAKSQALTQMINAEVIAGTLSAKQAEDLLTTVTGSADASGNYTGGLLGSATDWLLGKANDYLSGGNNLEYIDNTTVDEQDAYYGTNNLDQDAGTTSGMLYNDYSNYA